MFHARKVPPRDIARRHFRLALVLAMALAGLGALCGPQDTPKEIGRERAIEIARQEAHITGDSVEAVQATSDGRRVWRVTFRRRQPDAPPGLFETHIVEIDVRTGEIVSVSMS